VRLNLNQLSVLRFAVRLGSPRHGSGQVANVRLRESIILPHLGVVRQVPFCTERVFALERDFRSFSREIAWIANAPGRGFGQLRQARRRFGT
jgi:hypothetical protein